MSVHVYPCMCPCVYATGGIWTMASFLQLHTLRDCKKEPDTHRVIFPQVPGPLGILDVPFPYSLQYDHLLGLLQAGYQTSFGSPDSSSMVFFLMPPSPRPLNRQRSGGTPTRSLAALSNLFLLLPPRVTALFLRSGPFYWLVIIVFQLSAIPGECFKNTSS